MNYNEARKRYAVDMTLLDWFASVALVGYLAGRPLGVVANATELANSAYMLADEMLKASEARRSL